MKDELLRDSTTCTTQPDIHTYVRNRGAKYCILYNIRSRKGKCTGAIASSRDTWGVVFPRSGLPLRFVSVSLEDKSLRQLMSMERYWFRSNPKRDTKVYELSEAGPSPHYGACPLDDPPRPWQMSRTIRRELYSVGFAVDIGYPYAHTFTLGHVFTGM